MAHCAICADAGISKVIHGPKEGGYYKGRWYCTEHTPKEAELLKPPPYISSRPIPPEETYGLDPKLMVLLCQKCLIKHIYHPIETPCPEEGIPDVGC